MNVFICTSDTKDHLHLHPLTHRPLSPTTKQVKAVIHAAAESKRAGFDPQPEIMVPLVSIAKELKTATELVHEVAARELEALGTCVCIYMCIYMYICMCMCYTDRGFCLCI